MDLRRISLSFLRLELLLNYCLIASLFKFFEKILDIFLYFRQINLAIFSLTKLLNYFTNSNNLFLNVANLHISFSFIRKNTFLQKGWFTLARVILFNCGRLVIPNQLFYSLQIQANLIQLHLKVFCDGLKLKLFSGAILF